MNKCILDIVNNFNLWKGNVFTLAGAVFNHTKDDAAALVEAQGHSELADLIRAM